MDGFFLERSIDLHVSLRERLLEDTVIFPTPVASTVSDSGHIPDNIANGIWSKLHDCGLAVFQLDKPLTNDRLIALGLLLGRAIPETDLSVKRFVEREVILNLTNEYGHVADMTLQPFASNPLALHTESSGRRIKEQPKYLVLMCCEPGDPHIAAQTIFVSMSSIGKRLTSGELRILSQLRYRNAEDGQSILRRVRDRWVFSFRDFLSQGLEWTYRGDDGIDEDEINSAIRSLLVSLYKTEDVMSVQWTRGMLVIFDNTFFFHGRTAAGIGFVTQRRHLKRLRIAEHV